MKAYCESLLINCVFSDIVKFISHSPILDGLFKALLKIVFGLHNIAFDWHYIGEAFILITYVTDSVMIIIIFLMQLVSSPILR